MNHTSSLRNREGFTLLEILLAVALLGILAGIVILALNPAKQLADTRNAQRKVDINTILNAVYQYALDNNGNFPPGLAASIPIGTFAEICLTGSGVASATCAALPLQVDLQALTDTERYIVRFPSDPGGATTTFGTAYYIKQSTNGRITVKALNAEQGQTISVTR